MLVSGLWLIYALLHRAYFHRYQCLGRRIESIKYALVGQDHKVNKNLLGVLPLHNSKEKNWMKKMYVCMKVLNSYTTNKIKKSESHF